MCATFAYFTASVSGNDEASSVIVKTAQIGTITYENGTELKLDNAMPGADSDTMTFTIASDASSTSPVAYTIYWDTVTNGFNPTTDLVYTLTGDGASKGGQLVTNKTNEVAPTTKTTIGSGTIAPSETHTYQLKLHFKETGSEQNSNQGKSFTGRIQVSTADSGETYYNASNTSGTTEKPSAEAE